MDTNEKERFYVETADRLYRFCYRLTADRAEAEDIASEAFVRFFERADSIRESAAQVTYLFRIAVRIWNRTERRKKLLGLVTNNRANVTCLDERLALDLAIDKLSPKLRTALILVKAEGLTHAEAAEVLEVPIGTVQTRVFEAIKLVRASLVGADVPEVSLENQA